MKSKSQPLWEKMIFDALRFVWFTFAELYKGIKFKKIDVVRYIYPGTLLAAFFVLRADMLISKIPGLEWAHVSYGLRQMIVYLSLFAGWFIWAGELALHRTRVLSRLREAFLYAGLFANNNKLPGFIEDRPIDEHVRKLKLFTNGIPLIRFQENMQNLEGHLNISIVKMVEEEGDKSRINILYAMKDLTRAAKLDVVDGLQDGDVPIGISYEGPIIVNMRDVAHILVAGQTGGGKSNFEKVVAATLTVNNPESLVVFCDFKGGMEVADLTSRLSENYQNFQKYEGPKACAGFLAEYGSKMDDRFSELARLSASTFDDYAKKRLGSGQATRAQGFEASGKDEYPKRTYIIIDEIGQLYARDPSLTKETLLKARAAVNRIARQGRAAGIHLIVATQKPDATSFDQTVKANLPAILCFPMVSQSASVSALGTKRAYDLNPEIKGRAVWKYGPRIEEVQTYLFE